MKRKVRFFRSVNFKIAITFILILLISIEIIGAYFIRGLERSTINTFIKDMNQTVESLATTISPELNRKDNADDEEVMRISRDLLKTVRLAISSKYGSLTKKGSSEEQPMSMNKALWERKMIMSISMISQLNGMLL